MVFRLLILLIVLAAAPAAAQSGNASPAQPSTSDPQKPWWERLTFYGDMRVRYEGFLQDDTPTRQRGRYRLRLGIRAPIADGLNLNVRLASGAAADVTSTNQTFTEFWNRKAINIDQASLTFTPPHVPRLTLGAGKFAYPLTRTQMVWDDDVNWEGAFEQMTWSAGAMSGRVVAVQAPLNDVGRGSDAFMFGNYAQAGFRAGRHTLQFSVADYAFKNPDQLAIALDEQSDIRTQQNNAVRRNEQGDVIGYASGFNLVDSIAQVTLDTGRREYPVVVVGNVVINTRAIADEDLGIWLSGTYGRAAVRNSYSLSYTFARIERDAVLTAYNFSDMGPASNVVMNMATLSFMPVNRLNLDMIAIFTRLLDAPLESSNPTLTRIQIDARVSF